MWISIAIVVIMLAIICVGIIISIIMMGFMACVPFIACIFTLILMIIVFVVLALGMCGVVSVYIIAALFQSIYVGAGGSITGVISYAWEVIRGACAA